MSAYLDEELAPRGRSRFERHISECTQCRRLLASLTATLEALRRVPSARGGADARQIAASVRVRLTERRGGGFNWSSQRSMKEGCDGQ